MLDINQLAKAGVLKKYDTDEVFFHQGDPGHEMYILLKGRVRLFITSIDGADIPVMELTAGEFFGEMSLLENAPRSATIQALEECLVIMIDENNFEEVVAGQPALAFRIMKGMSNRIRQLNEELSQLKKGERPPAKLQAVSKSAPAAHTPEWGNLAAEGHQSYPDIAPATDAGYIFEKEITCPVCGQNFTTTMTRSSRLKLRSVDADLRQRFQDFNPLWYMVWVCPHCYYANFNFEFKQVDQLTKKMVLAETERVKALDFKYSFPRCLNEVFLAYYLVLNSLKTEQPDPARIAKVWLRLSWLYDDAGDAEMFRYASAQALEYFTETYYNARRDTSLEQDQRLALLLAELNLRTAQPAEALKHYRNAIVHKGGSAVINRQAEDRIQELKKVITAEE